MKNCLEQEITQKQNPTQFFVLEKHKQTKAILREQLNQIYDNFFISNTLNIPPFEQIDHGPKQLCTQLFSIQQNCLVISYQAFEKYYECLFKMLTQQEDIGQTLKAANILLSMNGQNDRAWNLKKKYLLLQSLNGPIQGNVNLKGQTETGAQIQYFSIQWQLTFNAAVCLKCKKSSSYYEYRLRLIQIQLNQLVLNQQINIVKVKDSMEKILERQENLIKQVLARFFRNYFVWMYRVKLIKLLYDKIQSLSEEYFEHKEETISQKQETLDSTIQPYNSLLQVITIQQLQHIHKFLQKYCNDYSGYSYLISFSQRYIIEKSEHKLFKSVNSFLQEQVQWAKQLNEYCELAYDSNQHYKHLLMYRNHLMNLGKQYSIQLQFNSVDEQKSLYN